MQLFHRIDDAECIVRAKGGVLKQLELYRRGDRVFVKALGGFVRIVAKLGDTWGTSNPSINVVEMPTGIPYLKADANKEPRWTGETGA